jgi:hypothetical protein
MVAIQVVLKNVWGNSGAFQIRSTSTVRQLYEAIRMNTGIPIGTDVEQATIIFAGSEISPRDSDRTLGEIGSSYSRLEAGSMISVMDRHRSIGPRAKPIDTVKEGDFAKGPAWRVLSPGMGIDGICKNSRCKAHGDTVIHNCGFGTFDLVNDQPKCPECGWGFEAGRALFTRCGWRVNGRQRNGMRVRLPWGEVTWGFEAYDEKGAEREKFERLLVQAVRLAEVAGMAARDDD